VFPRSYILKTPHATAITTNLLPFPKLAKNEGETVQLPKQGQFTVSYKKVEFLGEKSPLVFRIFLTFRTGKEGTRKEFFKEHVFFISEICHSEFDDNSFPDHYLKQPNRLN
jgi:hypothetical protein